MDNQQPHQPIVPTVAQSPSTQAPQAQTALQQQPAMTSVEPKGLKTTGGVVALIFGILTTVTGLIQATASPLAGIIIFGLGVFWFVTGILIFKSSVPAKSAKLLQRAGASAVAYTGILFFGAFFLPLFKFSAVLLPLIFAVTLAIVSSRYGRGVKNQ